MRKHFHRKAAAVVIAAVMISIAGCGTQTQQDAQQEPQDIQQEQQEAPQTDVIQEQQEAARTGDVKEQHDDDKEQQAEENSSDDAAVEEEDDVSAADKAQDEDLASLLADAFAQHSVDNNGSYFVRAGNKVFFREIGTESIDEGAIFGEFLGTEYTPVRSPLVCYDMNTCESREIGQITGIGELFACPRGFYIGYMNPDSFDSYCVEFYDMVSGKQDSYCMGIPRGISQSGEILVVDKLEGQGFNTALIKDGEEIAVFGGENIYYEYCGFVGETLILMLHTANEEEYVLCSVDENGVLTELGKMSDSENGYPEIKQFIHDGDDVYLNVGYYEGTGHFLSGWHVIKATCGASGSVTVAMDAGSAETKTEETVPYIYIDETGTLCDAEHLPYDVYLGSADSANDLCYYDDIYEEHVIIDEFIKSGYEDKCSVIQNIASFYDTAFIIYADVEADPEYDVGWRMGYRLKEWHICAVPFFDHMTGDEPVQPVYLN